MTLSFQYHVRILLAQTYPSLSLFFLHPLPSDLYLMVPSLSHSISHPANVWTVLVEVCQPRTSSNPSSSLPHHMPIYSPRSDYFLRPSQDSILWLYFQWPWSESPQHLPVDCDCFTVLRAGTSCSSHCQGRKSNLKGAMRGPSSSNSNNRFLGIFQRTRQVNTM